MTTESLMGSTSVKVEPFAGSLGAEIEGVELSDDLGNQTFDAIHRALLKYHVVVFRDQKLEPKAQVEFARRFGKPLVFRYAKGMAEAPEITEIINRHP